jgi:7-carboxy-7-deazaguanine synthase
VPRARSSPTHVSTTLKVSEVFDSLQGEGASTGQPCTFLRLAGCNLHCTWCDTKYTWDWEHYSYQDNVSLETVSALADRLHDVPRLVITGGEPLLQQAALSELLDLLPAGLFVEVETNGTRAPSTELLRRVNQWNVSPKLANSGEPHERRIVGEVLATFRDSGRAYLKLVVSDEASVSEATSLLASLAWPPSRAMFMPQATTRNAVLESLPQVAHWAVNAGVALSPRLHLLLWDGERAR